METLRDLYEAGGLKLVESNDKKRPGVLGVVEGPFFVYNSPSRNGRMYPKDLWENTLRNNNTQRFLRERLMFGTIGHSDEDLDTLIREQKISHVVTELKVGSDGKGYGRAEILDTPVGKMLKTLLESGSKLSVSSKAYGEYDGQEGGVWKVNPSGFVLERFDFVVDPGFLEAQPKLKEAFEKVIKDKDTSVVGKIVSEKKKIEEKVMQLMKEIDERDKRISDIEEKLNKATDMRNRLLEKEVEKIGDLVVKKYGVNPDSISADSVVGVVKKIREVLEEEPSNEIGTSRSDTGLLLGRVYSCDLELPAVESTQVEKLFEDEIKNCLITNGVIKEDDFVELDVDFRYDDLMDDNLHSTLQGGFSVKRDSKTIVAGKVKVYVDRIDGGTKVKPTRMRIKILGGRDTRLNVSREITNDSKEESMEKDTKERIRAKIRSLVEKREGRDISSGSTSDRARRLERLRSLRESRDMDMRTDRNSRLRSLMEDRDVSDRVRRAVRDRLTESRSFRRSDEAGLSVRRDASSARIKRLREVLERKNTLLKEAYKVLKRVDELGGIKKVEEALKNSKKTIVTAGNVIFKESVDKLVAETGADKNRVKELVKKYGVKEAREVLKTGKVAKSTGSVVVAEGLSGKKEDRPLLEKMAVRFTSTSNKSADMKEIYANK